VSSPLLTPDIAPSAELVVVSWLKEIGRAGTRRKAGDPIPFRLVTRIAGADDPELCIDTAVVSVHTFAATPEAAVEESQKTHRRMSVLTRNPLTTITLIGSGDVVNVDYCKTVMNPIEVEYSDPNVTRYVARYEIGLSYV
jgi:hypothetical protein